jgi:peptide/nickel transport system ATP-binding protein
MVSVEANRLNLLTVSNLSISSMDKILVNNFSFSVEESEIVGVVGESGSGKSICCYSFLNLLPPSLKVGGKLLWKGQPIDDEKGKIGLRGREISFVFQEPMSALNPSMTLGKQLEEVYKKNIPNISNSEAKNKSIQSFIEVKIPNPESVYDRYPHQISGGQQQRVCLAMALAAQPQLLIADEPTTALDVCIQAEMMDLLKEMIENRRNTTRPLSLLFISHDLPLVASICDRMMVLRKGELVEQGTTSQIMNAPKHDYTRGLILTKPKLGEKPHRLLTVEDVIQGKTSIQNIKEKVESNQSILFSINNLSVFFSEKRNLFTRPKFFKALDSISFEIFKNKTLGIVGESGSGKSTLAKTLIGLQQPSSGNIHWNGKNIQNFSQTELTDFRKSVQYIFQNPDSALNPRLTIQQALIEPRRIHFHETESETLKKAIEIIELVGINKNELSKYPHQFSGGQKQRMVIARALMMEPQTLILDESVAALDVSVQAQVLNLLNDLKEQLQLTYVFISHDLSVVQYFCDDILVLNKGKIEEIQPSMDLFNHPKSLYTQNLLRSIPTW